MIEVPRCVDMPAIGQSSARKTRVFLPRKTRFTLSRLRTNKSPFLLSYKHKINPTLYPSPLCPLCKNDEHNTSHLFNCTHIPTTLTPLDLWNAPHRVTELLEAWEEKVAALSG